jgi:hypothetical protein
MAGRLLCKGLIDFFSSNFLVIIAVAFIESNDLRIGNFYSATENFCSLFSILGMTFTFAFPSILFYLYWVRLREVNPKAQHAETIKTLLAAHRGDRADLLPYLKKISELDDVIEGNRLSLYT